MSTTLKIIVTSAMLTVTGTAICEIGLYIVGTAVAGLGILGLMLATMIADIIKEDRK